MNDGGIIIGNDCYIGTNFHIFDTDFHKSDPRLRNKPPASKKIVIGNNVFVGMTVTICKEVIVGDNSVIGAGSVVVKDIPENVVAAGNPAKVKKSLISEGL